MIGHIGYTHNLKNLKTEGQKKSEIKKLLGEARLIEKAGAFSISDARYYSSKAASYYK